MEAPEHRLEISNLLTAASYFWISSIILYFVGQSKLARNFYSKHSKAGNGRLLLPFVLTIALFSTFIFACGTVHLVMGLNMLNSETHKSVLDICCGVSVLTAIASAFVFPAIVRITDKLELTNEGKLRQIQNRLIDVIDACQESIIILSPEYKVLSANKSTTQIFGKNCTNEKRITSFIHKHDIRAFQDGVARLHDMNKHCNLDDETLFTGDSNSIDQGRESLRVHVEYRVKGNGEGNWKWVESTLTLRETDRTKPKVTAASHSRHETWPDLPLPAFECRVNFEDVEYTEDMFPFIGDDYDLMMLSRDISHRKREDGLRLLEEQARAKEQENQAKLQYITSCAHDLKTPLQSFEFAIELLCQTPLQTEQLDILEQARISSSLMALTISQTTDISRALMGIRLVPKKKTIRLSKIISRTAVVIETYSRDVSISFHLSSLVKNHIISDEEWLWQMMLNYLTNASKFTESGSIDVYLNCLSALDDQHPVKRQQASSKTVGSGPDMLLFEVIDTGVGVSESNIPHLFKVFGQAQVGQLAGTGMGLYGVKIRCEGLNGKCGMYNRVDVSGSVFWFLIPYVVDDSKYADTDSLPRPGDGHSESVANASLYEKFQLHFPLTQEANGDLIVKVPVLNLDKGGRPRFYSDDDSFRKSLSNKSLQRASYLSNPSSDTSKLTAYVIDDSLSIRKLMNRTLLNMDFDSVELFENGSKGLQAMKEKQVDVVFMDIQMPVLSGHEAVSRLRQFEVESGRKKRQLVVAVSANFTLEDQHNLVSMSMFDAIVPKPMHAAEIDLIVRDYNAGRLPLKGAPSEVRHF